jgi:hypothetical protein
MHFPRSLFPSALALLASFHVSGQLVTSVRSGVVHFSEGSVFIDDHAVDQKFGTFPSTKEGSTLRTEEGRAEVLLTPGVLLRIDQNSSIRMISTAIKDTRLEFLGGSVILDSQDASGDGAVLISYKDSQIRFPKKGVYRMDSEPPVLQVYNGEADVIRDGKSMAVDPTHLFFFSLALQTQKFGDGADDDFYQWSKDRSDFISADNQSAALSAADPGQMDSGQTPARDPDVYLGMPGYGGLGIPSYGAQGGTLGFDYSLSYSNAPFGMGVWNMYSIYFIYLPRYHRWPVGSPSGIKTHSGLPQSPGLPRHPGLPHYPGWHPGLPPTRIGISRPSPIAPVYGLRGVPRVGTVAPRYAPHPSPLALPSVGAGRLGAPGMGRAPAIGHR